VYALSQTAGALRRPLAVIRGRLAAARSEAGFTLIEVIMSAALLAVVTGGVYAGIDGPAKVSGNAKARAAAANLAQTEQETMRSKRFVDLQNYNNTRTQAVDGVNFTIVSRADWVDDSSASSGCSVGGTQGDYLKLTSTVSWPGGGAGNPVAITSVMAPPVDDGTNGTGNIVMRLQDQAGGPVAGIPVTIDGRTTVTRTTDSAGCAVFSNVPAGDYTATFSQSGYVDNQNVQLVSVPASLRAGDTVQLTHAYARAAAVKVTFVDSANNSISWPRASVAGGTLLSPLKLTGAAPLSTGQTLYPTTSGSYVAWAGNCADPGASYDGIAQPSPAPPGGIATAVVTVPTLKLSASSTGIIGTPRVTVKSADATCTDTFAAPAASLNSGTYTWPISLPYGTYTVCADMSGFKTSPAFTLPNLVKTGSNVTLSLVLSGPTITGVKAVYADGSQPPQTVGVTPGSCP
jgi:prepilin-type N-terminal cleavage/methylation domain-containing protein